MIGKMFSTPKPKKFSIGTRYYDADKEDFRSRERKAKAEMGIKDENGNYIPNIKGKFRSAMPSASKTADVERQKSNRRLLVIFTILILIALIILRSDFISQIFS